MLQINQTSGKWAICISGEIRTAIEAWPSFERFFGQDHDVFIHCWQEDDLLIDRVKKLYKPLAFMCEPHNHRVHSVPFSSMLYSMMMANNLKRMHEASRGQRYDAVIKTRFDLVFDPYCVMPKVLASPRTINVIGLSNGLVNVDFDLHGINDVMFWGDSTSMDVACDTYRYFLVKCRPSIDLYLNGINVDPHDLFLSPGMLIYQNCIKRNVYFEYLAGYDTVILRKHAMHLDPVRDFRLIREECSVWKP